MKEFKLKTVMMETGAGMFCGVLADNAVAGLLHPAGDLVSQITAATLGGIAGPLVDVLGTHFYKLGQADLARQRIMVPLENAVKFSCVRHPTIKAD